jgi:phospholipase/carboxylesterase
MAHLGQQDQREVVAAVERCIKAAAAVGKPVGDNAFAETTATGIHPACYAGPLSFPVAYGTAAGKDNCRTAASPLSERGRAVGAVVRPGRCTLDGSRSPASLTARPPETPPSRPLPLGRLLLGLEQVRDSLLYVPPGLHGGIPAGLVLTLHGAGADAAAGLSLLAPVADEYGLALLAPASRGSTWDAVGHRYGPDVSVIDRALDRVFRTIPVDPAHVGIAGFSDGASYALGLGLANGSLIRRIIAFSPGFIPPAPRVGKPAVFVSHGDHDVVLPIGSTSRRIVPALRQAGYDVVYREFPGAHAIPEQIAREAAEWLGW